MLPKGGTLNHLLRCSCAQLCDKGKETSDNSPNILTDFFSLLCSTFFERSKTGHLQQY